VPVVEGYSDELLTDKGGREYATAAERRVIETAQTARRATMLILAEAARSGFIVRIDGTWDLAPGAKELARFLSLEVKALQAIGLEHRAKPVQSLEEYIAEHDAKAAATDNEAEGDE
jgi:hypothetical protein